MNRRSFFGRVAACLAFLPGGAAIRGRCVRAAAPPVAATVADLARRYLVYLNTLSAGPRFPTIQAALDAAEPGDVIGVLPGHIETIAPDGSVVVGAPECPTYIEYGAPIKGAPWHTVGRVA